MAHLLEDYSLKDYNTFGLDAKCKYFFSFEKEVELQELLHKNPLTGNDVLVIGGGSNLLFSEDYKGLVIYPNIKDIELKDENERAVLVRAGAGVKWDDFVAYAVENSWCGVENLSYIPGNVGASPVQNVGAYGMEAGDSIHSVEAINIETGEKVIFSSDQCNFAYRDSIFKNEYKNLFIVTYVNFVLYKEFVPKLDYGSIAKDAEDLGEISLKNIRKAVIAVRKSKLPEPEELGNAGSFFKNPVVDEQTAERLRKSYSDMPEYKVEEGIKLAAGWLIDQCGLKGYRQGKVGVHDKQALVLVNYGGATGMEIIKLANYIKKQVFIKFGVNLEQEVRVI